MLVLLKDSRELALGGDEAVAGGAPFLARNRLPKDAPGRRRDAPRLEEAKGTLQWIVEAAAASSGRCATTQWMASIPKRSKNSRFDAPFIWCRRKDAIR